MLRFFEATFILTGAIIGVGMFAIPFSFITAGFWLGIVELILITAVVIFFHLSYGEVILGTSGNHRLPGYAHIHLGKKAAYVAWASAWLGAAGTMLAYALLGGLFLDTLLSELLPGTNALVWTIAVIAMGAAVTSGPRRQEAFINGIFTVLLVVFILILAVLLIPYIKTTRLSGFNIGELFAPYGVLLFALTGGTVIPEVLALLGRDRKRARRAIMIGTIVPAILYLLFTVAVVGAVGFGVSEEAIAGLGAVAGPGLVAWGSALGFLAVFTSLVPVSANFQSLLRFDLGTSPLFAWFLSVTLPLGLYIFGVQDFTSVIAIVGACAFGVDAVLVFAMRQRMQDQKKRRHPYLRALRWIFGIIIVGSALVEVWSIFYG